MNVSLQEEVTCTVPPLPKTPLCNFKQQFTGNSGSSFYNENGQKVVFFKEEIVKNRACWDPTHDNLATVFLTVTLNFYLQPRL